MSKPKSLKEALSEFLNEKEMQKATTSFDIIGNISIIEIPDSLEKYKTKIGKALLEVHPHLKTVCMRAGEHEGEYRIRHVDVIAGEKNTLTEYKESGARMLVDVDKVYFTPRLSHERERVAEQVKAGESIGYFFAGVGPYAFVILINQSDVSIDAVEINPDAYDLLKENIKLNKCEEKVNPIFGDVSKVCKNNIYDRIIMPLPKSAHEFLPLAFNCSKTGTIIHFYTLGERKKPYTQGENIIEKTAYELNVTYKIENKKIARPYSPSHSQVVFDIRVL